MVNNGLKEWKAYDDIIFRQRIRKGQPQRACLTDMWPVFCVGRAHDSGPKKGKA